MPPPHPTLRTASLWDHVSCTAAGRVTRIVLMNSQLQAAADSGGSGAGIQHAAPPPGAADAHLLLPELAQLRVRWAEAGAWPRRPPLLQRLCSSQGTPLTLLHPCR